MLTASPHGRATGLAPLLVACAVVVAACAGDAEESEHGSPATDVDAGADGHELGDTLVGDVDDKWSADSDAGRKPDPPADAGADADEDAPHDPGDCPAARRSPPLEGTPDCCQHSHCASGYCAQRADGKHCASQANPDARCVDRGHAGSFCGLACGQSSPCPAGYDCKPLKDVEGNNATQCVPALDALCKCSGAAIEKGLHTACATTTGDGLTCPGSRRCAPDGAPGAPAGGGLTTCQGSGPQTETCDLADNDCDGQTDEAACADGNPCTKDSCSPTAPDADKDGCWGRGPS